MVKNETEPRTIRLEAEHYILRTVEPGDEMGSWGGWLTDPRTARMLNARQARLSEASLRAYVQGFDRITSHLLGIFEKDSGRMIGMRALYIDQKRNDFLVSVIIGETHARNKGARAETGEAMYRYFFEVLELEAAHCTVLPGNAIILHVMDQDGWVLERKSKKPAASGEGMVELLHFRLTREVWRLRQG